MNNRDVFMYCFLLLILIGNSCGMTRKQYINKKNYWDLAGAMSNYYVGDNFKIYTSWDARWVNKSYFEKKKDYDSLEVRNAHLYSALNNHAIQAYHFRNFHIDDKNYMPHLAYTMKKLDIESCKANKYCYHSSSLSRRWVCSSCDYLPEVINENFKNVFPNVHNNEVVNSLGNFNVYKYVFSDTGTVTRLMGHSHNYLYFVESEFDQVRESDLLALLINNYQIFLSSWFYSYRVSCKALWEEHFLAIIDTSAVWRSLRRNEMKFNDKQWWQDFETTIKMPENLKKVSDNFINEAFNPQGLYTTYFKIILHNDYAPKDIVYKGVRKKKIRNHDAKYGDNGSLIRMEFYSQKKDKNYLLKYYFKTPYEFEIKEL